MKRKKLIFFDCIKRNAALLAVLTVALVINGIVFFLYGYSFEPIIYGGVLSLATVAVIFTVDLFKTVKKARERELKLAEILSKWDELQADNSLCEQDYRQMIKKLGRELSRVTSQAQEEREEMLDYFTTWVHQIKTPIAVMKLSLTDENERDKALAAELFRIEQYVEMVLQYIRLDSQSNDLLIEEYSLDEIIRKIIRKYASQFIAQKVRLEFIPTGTTVITDSKWLFCVIEQIISNAVKYSPNGCVTVKLENGRLIIKDSGIGIEKEDIPRIFEKGFTGANGRSEQKSSGLGLYLCKRAADKIAVKISVTSQRNCGTEFALDLDKLIEA